MTVIAPGSKFFGLTNETLKDKRKYRDWEVEDDVCCDGPFRMMKKINTVQRIVPVSGKKGGMGKGDRAIRDMTRGTGYLTEEIKADGGVRSGKCITFC
jgi:hypothetical protein